MKNPNMKKLLTGILVLAAVLCLFTAASADSSGTCGKGMTWELDSKGTLKIYGKGVVEKGDWDEADVQQVLFSSSVTGIGNNAFWGCFHMKYAYLTEGMTSVGQAAFYECDELETVTLPDTLVSIGNYAFDACPSLKELFIPDLLENVGKYTFDPGTLLYASVGTSGAKALGQSGISFRDQELYCDLQYQFSRDKETGLILKSVYEIGSSYTVPEEVTVIGEQVFKDMTTLREIILPDSLTAIGDYAFLNCTGLQSVTMPKKLATIGKDSFYNCSSLGSIVIPSGVTAIGEKAFGCCTRLAEITLPDTLTSIGNRVFMYCAQLESVSVPASVTKISPAAFAFTTRSFFLKVSKGTRAERLAKRNGLPYDNGDRHVAELTITEADRKADWIISNYLYSSMSEKDTALALHNWLIYNADYDTTGRNTDASGVLVRGYGTDSSYAEAYSLLLKKAGLASRVIIGGGSTWNLVRIDGQWYHVDVAADDPSDGKTGKFYVISGGENSRHFMLSDSKMKKDHTWDSSISADQNQVGEYTEPDPKPDLEPDPDPTIDPEDGPSVGGAVLALDEDARTAAVIGAEGADVTEVTIPAAWKDDSGNSYKITAIAANAFNGNKKLTKVTIGKNVKTIGQNAFSGCGKLKAVSGMAAVTAIGDGAFRKCTSLANFTISKNVTKIGKDAFNGCKKLAKITVKAAKLNSKSIGKNAFKGIGKKAVFSCPKGKASAYGKLFRKAGAPKGASCK